MNKHWVLLISAILLGISFYAYLFFSHFSQLPAITQNIAGYSVSIITSVGVVYTVHWINTLLDSSLSWKRHFLTRFSLSTLVTVVLALIIMMSVAFMYFKILENTEAGQLIEGYKEEIIKTLILLFFAAIIFNTGYFAFYSYRQYSFIQISKVTQERKQLRLQFEALKSQLSPHYLFNSLNTISSLVYKDPIAAEDFIRRLALTFKYVITTDKQKLVPLREEVEFIKSYYHLLKVRFGNSLNLEINIPEDVLLTSIPPLTLQILVENAVKHNQFNKDNRLEIFVGTMENKFLRVSNNKLTPAEDVRSFRVGLDNIRMRYSFYSDSNIKIENEDFFMVQLPILEKAG